MIRVGVFILIIIKRKFLEYFEGAFLFLVNLVCFKYYCKNLIEVVEVIFLKFYCSKVLFLLFNFMISNILFCFW